MNATIVIWPESPLKSMARPGWGPVFVVALAAACGWWIPAACPQSDVAASVEKGRRLKNQGKLDEAHKVLQQAVRQASENAEAHFVLAWVLAAKGEKEMAAQHFREVVRLAPGTGQAKSARDALARLGPPGLTEPEPRAPTSSPTRSSAGATTAVEGAARSEAEPESSPFGGPVDTPAEWVCLALVAVLGVVCLYYGYGLNQPRQQTPSTQAPSTSPSARAPNAGRGSQQGRPPIITVGMSTDEVVRLLGRPTAKTDAQAVMNEMTERFQGNSIIFTGVESMDQEFWLYNHPAGKYELVLDGGKVTQVQSQPSSAAASSVDSGRRIPAALGGRDDPDAMSLQDAVATGDVRTTQALLEGGVDANALDSDGQSALHLLAIIGSTLSEQEGSDLARLLLRHGARTDHVSPDGYTPLELAVLLASTAVAAVLLDHDAA